MGGVKQHGCGSYSARRDDPVLFVEQIALASWLRAGDPVSDRASRLRRPIRQVRAMLFGEAR